MYSSFAPDDTPAIPLHVIEKDGLSDWLRDQPDHVATWVDIHDFKARLGQALLIPDETGAPFIALAGYGAASSRARKRFYLGGVAGRLPKGTYRIASGLPEEDAETEVLGWLLTGYRFDRYHKQSALPAQLQCPENVDKKKVEEILKGEALTRDLINTPTSDMGPEELEAAARSLAEEHGATMESIVGQALLDQNLPLIHTVGRASGQAPRLLDMSWGDKGPKITLVGKGVCFDTGGLNIKPSGAMNLMKKDMGGAANVLGLAHMLMATKQDIRLRVLIPAVENSVSGVSFRPGDILTSRKGLTIEINNTDAEGRLVLADALAFAQEDNPDFIVSMATLTGAARVAVGADLAPFFCDYEDLVAQLEGAAKRCSDPVWRMPFYNPYEPMIEPGIADLDNAPRSGFGGSITAALFLRKFVETSPYMHFDIYGWSQTNAPGRPKGGMGQGTRALFDMLRTFEPS